MKLLKTLIMCLAILIGCESASNVYCSVNSNSVRILNESQKYAIYDSNYAGIFLINKSNKTISKFIDEYWAKKSFEYKGYTYLLLQASGGMSAALIRNLFKLDSSNFKVAVEKNQEALEPYIVDYGSIIGFDANDNLIIKYNYDNNLYSLDKNLNASTIDSYDESKITKVAINNLDTDRYAYATTASDVSAVEATNSLGFCINDTKYNKKYSTCYNDTNYTNNIAAELANKTCDYIGADSQNIYYTCSYNFITSLLKSKTLKSIFNKEAEQIVSIISINRKTGKQSLVRILGREISYVPAAGMAIIDGEFIDGTQMKYVSKIQVTVAKFDKYCVTREGIFYNNKKLVSANYIMKPVYKNNYIYYYDYDGINVKYNKYDVRKNILTTITKYSVAKDLEY